MLNYDIYSKEFQKLQPTHGGTISNSENGQMVYIYRAYFMHAFSHLLSHGGYIYTAIYMVLMMLVYLYVV